MSSSNQFAVVTGASSGIGLELAKQFAINGFDLLITSESSAIESAAQEIQFLGGKVETVQADLSTREGVHALYSRILASGRPVDAIAINAGVGVGGPFTETDIDEEIKMIDLNVTSSVHLAKHVVRDMVARGSGKVLITSSIASTMPDPFEAVYGATKSFLQSFALALRNELKDTGVSVTALMPGPTETNFFHRAGLDDTRVGQSKKDDPADVAKQGFEALMNGEDKVLAASMKTKIMGAANSIMPDAAKAEMHRKMSEPGSGKKSA